MHDRTKSGEHSHVDCATLLAFITLSIVLPLQDRFEHAKRIVCTVGGACGMVANSGLANSLPQFHKFYSTSSALRRCCLTLPLVALCGPHISTFHSKKCSKDGVKGHTVARSHLRFICLRRSLPHPGRWRLGLGQRSDKRIPMDSDFRTFADRTCGRSSELLS